MVERITYVKMSCRDTITGKKIRLFFTLDEQFWLTIGVGVETTPFVNCLISKSDAVNLISLMDTMR
jgi:hypothetical protein